MLFDRTYHGHRTTHVSNEYPFDGLNYTYGKYYEYTGSIYREIAYGPRNSTYGGKRSPCLEIWYTYRQLNARRTVKLDLAKYNIGTALDARVTQEDLRETFLARKLSTSPVNNAEFRRVRAELLNNRDRMVWK